MNTFMMRITFIFAILLVTQVAVASGMDACSIKKAGKVSVGKSVSFQGSILSDGMHNTLILPDKCKETGFQIAPDDDEGSPGKVIRESVMKVGSPGTGDKKIVVDVEAKVVVLGNQRIGLKISKLKHLVLTYPGGD